jgi:hypothetical protein
MDWTTKDAKNANHNPDVVVNGVRGKAPVAVTAKAGTPIRLDAAGTQDPDGHALTYRWFFYAEAGTGIPGQPVATGAAVPIGGGGNRDEGGIPSAPAGGPPQPPVRVTLADASTPRVTVTPRVPGTAHIILAVEDNGSPSLTSYRRVILTIAQ